jgi:hypothetical protein
MPLPLAPFLPFAVRIGAVAAVALAARRWVRGRTFPGRTDQRAEDAFDDLGEGLSLHRPADRTAQAVNQTNGTARMVRVIRFRGKLWEADVGMITRLRIRQIEE